MKKRNQYFEARNRVVIALGDPAGIGTEITLKALGSLLLPKNMQPLLVGCKRNAELTYYNLKTKGIKSLANPKDLEFEDIPFKEHVIAGQPSQKTGKASFNWLTRANEIVLKNEARALVTAPIAKHTWHAAGHNYPGQTERLAELTSTKNPSMLFTAKSPFTSWRLNTLLATTHIPLAEVPRNLSPELIISKLDTLLNFCQKFNNEPKLAIAGLNPHAGEKGQLGNEEIQWLNPVIEEWRVNNPNVILEGPISPDTCWISTAQSWKDTHLTKGPDGILALYHDQGLIPVKIIAFDYAVNTTLGLPFIRTSPDHGTGFDIAGKGIANSKSMFSAIETAWELSDV
ncbi:MULTISPECIES: 4-hydroxythreonine-4-phosphate dehydrogenase PdxA [Prochlorococcus]|uniref:Pyridoxal phosphate biosynthesis protein n=1 Tax=Prochlorococcus marinus (strain SARG / CCMP1375 / SS120) TaxID=167539 RepID=Q7VEI5_PROMA|nr:MULTISPECIES: 4-hydroxythreonine-4-phosphate dehydrogenase PdxA [Prochlorococcus]AAP99074.1 Pyridoxal phosphate biosynthesis protein [Prochlorococcus marinus subsp. marinus str. CCMP1375]KGG11669.1 4-hydroxythreonine-4-phosphate dehydrogenase [Prochlorococcus marinus str. LG]KGG22322.1 4-hydroxythreonine-4-phosphate dehydrogenase [Prochlorococcus marinus str. SS2]KGG22659.1 4-hydroxythreonine-4-phosphate dehydrogenase [Prochlorococcus marinus str. SS35]KGG32920.1 4-hydroxythreonine-4-phosph